MKKGTLFFLLLATGQASAYQVVDGRNFIFSELLVWKLREGSAENWAQTISPAGTTRSAFLHDAPFPWDAGFRFGIGRESSDHLCNSALTYTHYQTTGLRDISTIFGGIDSAFTGNFFANNPSGTGFGPNYHHAEIDWKFLFNTFDLSLSYKIDIDSILIIRPILGIKAAVINQTLNSHWLNPTVATTFSEATETLKNNFWGIGPSIGLESIWPIYRRAVASLNLSGKLSTAILAGRWSFEDNYLNGTPTSVTVNMDNIYGATTMASAFIGLEWVGEFSNINMMAQLGYEAQVWFNQLQYYSFNMGKLNHLMSLQGGVLDFYVNF
ncbi:MAG: hypothetical protein BGO43_08700 [Gammaproteobacteria bacterium 39-13]|nr:hypothetical protein [Gammaproteobacteria bacterium]OJV94321.1 MAG: hypothetical protein BGO43_08700 [Gammaproteobacteria bacterium 39-13]